MNEQTQRRPARWVALLRDGIGSCWLAMLDLLCPPRCVYCGQQLLASGAVGSLCERCRQRLTMGDGPFCQGCGAFTTVSGHSAPSCPWCWTHRLHFDRVIPFRPYRGDMRQAILRLKGGIFPGLCEALVDLYHIERGECLAYHHIDVAVAVPLHWSRQFQRGYNPAMEIGTRLARRLGVPFDRHLLSRTRATRLQPGLTTKQRFRNVRRAFAVDSAYDLAGASVLLVDDILTTGATCSEIARVLKTAGAASVTVAVLARSEG